MKHILSLLLVAGFAVGCAKKTGSGQPLPPLPPPQKQTENQVPPPKAPPGSETSQELTKDVVKIRASTGMRASDDLDFVSLTDDGLMAALQRHLMYESDAQLKLNKSLAATLVNGKLTRDESTGDIWVTLKVRESSQNVSNYKFSVQPIEGEMAPMVPYFSGSSSQGIFNLQASLMCVDVGGACEVAVVKLFHSEHVALVAGKATSLMILRRQYADIDANYKNKETSNKDLTKIRDFFINQRRFSDDEGFARAMIESFEVAFGTSVVRTLIYGDQKELIGHTSALVSSRGALSVKMRAMNRASDDFDMMELRNRTSFMASTLGNVMMRKNDGEGNLILNYRMLKQTPGGEDEFTLAYKLHPVSLLPVDYLKVD